MPRDRADVSDMAKGKGGEKRPKVLGPATIAKPALIGAARARDRAGRA